MASAGPAFPSTKETTNYARLCRLLVDAGSQVLRETFDKIHPPGSLGTVLGGPPVCTTLQNLRNKKILNASQWGKLYPAIKFKVTSKNFDITLLMVLFRNICGLTPPATGWDNLPPATDLTREADIARIKFYRNTVYGHASQASVDDITFATCWTDIRDTLVRLGGATYEAAVDDLKDECMDPDIEEHYKELLKQWKVDEDSIKDKLDEMVGKLAELRTSVERRSAPVIANLSIVNTIENKVKNGVVINIYNMPGASQMGQTAGGSEGMFSNDVPVAQEREKNAGVEGSVAGIIQENQQDFPTELDIWNVILSFKKPLNLFFQYLKNNLNVVVRRHYLGSLLITVECSSLQTLAKLWEDYTSGHLNKVAQETLVTAEVLEKLGLTGIELKTFISEEEYEKGQQIFMQNLVLPEQSPVSDGKSADLRRSQVELQDTASGSIVGEMATTTELKESYSDVELPQRETCMDPDIDESRSTDSGVSSIDMSGIVEAPVTKYGRSSEFGAVLDFIQTMISNDTLRQAFHIPHLVMVGRQNMAKTTLINRLIGRYLLPMRHNETANTLQARTTYPIILNLRNGEKTIVEVKCDKYPDIGGEVENPTDDMVEEFLKQVASHLPKERGTPISKTPVTVTLQGPDLTTLTLVDLPGAHFANDDPRMNHVTQSLVLDYIKKNTKSIIVIVSEVGDPTGDSAINLVMQKAVDFRSRTICVLTKPDRLRESDDMGRKVATNQSSFTLEDGRFILLRGKDGTDAKEKDWDAEMTRLKEKEWFERHPQYKGILRLCGIDRLMDTMISLLAQKMITEIPILVRQMRERKAEVEEELKTLADSEVPESSEGKGALVMKVKQNLITQLKTLLFNNTTNIAGGEQVRGLFNKFHEAIYKVDPLALRSDEEIRRQQRKLEGVAAPLGDSSENSQLLQKLLYEDYQARSIGNPGLSTTGFLGVMPAAVQITEIQSPVDQLIPITEGLVNNVEKALREIVQGAIDQSLYKFPSLKQAVEAKVVSKIFDTKREQTTQFIRQFLEMQKKSIDDVFAPIPFPDEISTWEATTIPHNKTHPCMVSRTMRHLKDLGKKLYPKELIDEIEGRDIRGNYKELEDMRKVKKNVVRCFNVLKMNVCDTVPRCILHFFISQLVDDLELALEQENLVEFLKEKPEIRDRRKLCRAQFSALKEALPHTDDVLQKLLRMRDRSTARENLQF